MCECINCVLNNYCLFQVHNQYYYDHNHSVLKSYGRMFIQIILLLQVLLLLPLHWHVTIPQSSLLRLALSFWVSSLIGSPLRRLGQLWKKQQYKHNALLDLWVLLSGTTRSRFDSFLFFFSNKYYTVSRISKDYIQTLSACLIQICDLIDNYQPKSSFKPRIRILLLPCAQFNP